MKICALICITFFLIFCINGLEQSHHTKVSSYTTPVIEHNRFSEKREVGTPVDFTVFGYGKRFDFKLHEKRIFHENARIKTFDADENLISDVAPPSQHFASKDHNAQFTFFDGGRIKGTFHYNGEIYYIDPKSEHIKEVDEDMKRSVEMNVMFRGSDVFDVPADSSEEFIAKKRVETTQVQDVLPHGTGSGDTGPTFPYGQCTVEKTVTVSIAVDATYYNRAMRDAFPSDTIDNGLVTSYISAIMGTISQIYERQLGVALEIGDLELYPTYSTSPPWQEPDANFASGGYKACTNSIDAYLDPLFKNWVDQKNDNEWVTWHLFTDCFAVRFCGNGGPCSSVVGRAYMGILCYGNSGYNSGFSSWSPSPNGWLTIAHELGHNFAAGHRFELPDGTPLSGIMSYASTKTHEFTNGAFGDMCGELYGQTCIPERVSCTVDCTNQQCGESNCAGSVCGTCSGSQTCENGQCVEPPCDPQCSNVVCGSPDGCGGTCPCPPCTDTCQDRECGYACGVACGTCGDSERCSDYTCIADSEPWLSAHNDVRTRDGVNSLTWSSTLAADAQAEASQCNIGSSGAGTNTLLGAGDAGMVVAAWDSEKSSYNCETGECVSSNCNHYLQLVWESTTEVGCGCESCGGQQYCVCHYNPAGLALGERPFPVTSCPGYCVHDCTGKACGDSDGCGDICVGENGQCGANSVCSNTGVCECVPYISCAGKCGTIHNGCHNEVCNSAPNGGCADGEMCENGICNAVPCIPQLSCGTQQCGMRPDYCGSSFSCGSCVAGQICSNGECIDPPCSCTGYANAECVGGECVCSSGYVGTPATGCTLTSYPRGWQQAFCDDCGFTSSNFWQLSADSRTLSFTSPASDWQHSAALWSGSNSISDFGTVTFGATITIEEDSNNACAGLVVGLSDSTYAAFCLHTSFGLIARDQGMPYSQSYYRYWNLNPNVIPVVGQEYDMAVNLQYWGSTHVISILVDGSVVAGYYSATHLWPQITGNSAGVYASGQASFKNVALLSESTVVITVANCENPDQLRDSIALMLGVSPSSISLDLSECSKKRQVGEGVAVTVTITSSVSSVSSSVATASAPVSSVLATSLVSSVASASGPVVAAGIASASVAAPVAGVAITTVATATVVFGFSLLVAIIAGSAAVVAVTGTVVGVGVALSGNDDDENTVELNLQKPKVKFEQQSISSFSSDEAPVQPVQPAPSPKKPGVNIFNMDPNAPQSLTARQPAIRH